MALINWIIAFLPDWNSILALVLYWLPMLLCFVGYTTKTWVNYQCDVAERESTTPDSWKLYSPTDTIGSLIGRALLTILPVGNLLAAIFDVSPRMFANFFRWVGKVFDQPLVPRRSKA